MDDDSGEEENSEQDDSEEEQKQVQDIQTELLKIKEIKRWDLAQKLLDYIAEDFVNSEYVEFYIVFLPGERS